jgi:hypothetical protein
MECIGLFELLKDQKVKPRKGRWPVINCETVSTSHFLFLFFIFVFYFTYEIYHDILQKWTPLTLQFCNDVFHLLICLYQMIVHGQKYVI